MNVIVIGGGASGLMAAITAAKGGHSVTLLERQALRKSVSYSPVHTRFWCTVPYNILYIS